jgi:glycosyltransferase involved in cell wall biosynthesis
MNIKVLHIDTERGFRGGERQVCLLSHGLNKNSIESFIGCKSNSKLETYCKSNKLNHQSFSFKNEFDFVSAYKIFKFCKKNRITHIHIHTSHGILLSIFVKIVLPNISLYLSRRVDFPIKKNLVSKFKYQTKHIKKVICISKKIKQNLLKIRPKEELEVIYSGIDFDKYKNISFNNNLKSELNIDEKDIVIGTLAAFTYEKNYTDFVKIAKEIISQFPHCKFICCGDGIELPSIKSLVKKLNIERNFIFTGYINNIHDYINSFDLFLFTSTIEGLGSTLIDAQYHGKAIVAYKTGGIPEIVENNKNGFLHNIGEIENMAGSIVNLIKDKKLRDEFSDHAKHNALKFTHTEMIKKHIKLYSN